MPKYSYLDLVNHLYNCRVPFKINSFSYCELFRNTLDIMPASLLYKKISLIKSVRWALICNRLKIAMFFFLPSYGTYKMSGHFRLISSAFYAVERYFFPRFDLNLLPFCLLYAAVPVLIYNVVQKISFFYQNKALYAFLQSRVLTGHCDVAISPCFT